MHENTFQMESADISTQKKIENWMEHRRGSTEMWPRRTRIQFQQKLVVFMLNDIANLKSGRWKNAMLSLYGETEWKQRKQSYRCTGGSIWLIVSIENPALSQLCIESERKNMKLQRYWVRHTWIKSRECFRIDPSTFPLSPDFSVWKTRPHQFGSVAIDIQHNNSNRISRYLHLISTTIFILDR